MKRLLQLILLVFLCASSIVVVGVYYPFERIVPLNSPPKMRHLVEVPVNYAPSMSIQQFPFYGGAVLDLKGRGEMVAFLSGSETTGDAFLVYAAGQLIDIKQQTLIREQQNSYGASAIDMDNDGDTDIVVAREKQIFWYANNGGSSGDFVSNVLPVAPPTNMVFIDVAPADFNQDGLVDLLISAVDKNIATTLSEFHTVLSGKQFLLKGLGDGQYEDVSSHLGDAESRFSLFNIWADFNGDNRLDFISLTPSAPVSIWLNGENFTFNEQTIYDRPGLWGGLSVQDSDQDGDLDIMLTNIGNSIPYFMLDMGPYSEKEIRTDWLVLNNEPEGYIDVSYTSNVTELGNGFGVVQTDINLDGQLDLLAAQNHPQWFVHQLRTLPAKTMLGIDGAYYQTDVWKAQNPTYAASPLYADFLNNGKPDVLWLNTQSAPRVFLNKSESTFLSLLFPDTVRLQGAKVTANLSDGSKRHQFLIGRSGLGTDNSNEVFFGLNNEQHIQSVEVSLLDGSVVLLNDLKENQKNILYERF